MRVRSIGLRAARSARSTARMRSAARARPAPRALLAGLALTGLLLGAAGCSDSNAAHDASPRKHDASAPEARLRVRADPVRRALLEGSDRVTGTVRAFHRATLTAEIQGRVVERVVEPGTRVEAGGAIVALDDSRFALALRRAEASLSAARTVLAHAEREYARAQQLFDQDAISTQRHDDLRHAVERARDELVLAEVNRDAARRDLADTRILAPFAGTVDSIAVDVGDFVAPGTPVAQVVDLSRVRLFGGVTAREAARLQPGQVARVGFSDLGGAVFEATLVSVGRVADPKDGTYGIELWMEDPEGRLRDGLVAEIDLPDVDEGPQLLARRAALLRRDGRMEVFVVVEEEGGPVARPRPVRTGRSQGEWVEILDGLEVGDRVVWDGHFALDAGTPVVLEGDGAASPPNGGSDGDAPAPPAPVAAEG